MNRNLLSVTFRPIETFAGNNVTFTHQQFLNSSEVPPVALDDCNKNKSQASEVIAAK